MYARRHAKPEFVKIFFAYCFLSLFFPVHNVLSTEYILGSFNSQPIEYCPIQISFVGVHLASPSHGTIGWMAWQLQGRHLLQQIPAGPVEPHLLSATSIHAGFISVLYTPTIGSRSYRQPAWLLSNGMPISRLTLTSKHHRGAQSQREKIAFAPDWNILREITLPLHRYRPPPFINGYPERPASH